MVYAQPLIRSREWGVETFLGFWDINRLSNLGQKTRPSDSQQRKKRTCRMVDLAVPADHRVKGSERKWKEAKRKISTWIFLENRKTMEHESDGNTDCNWCAWYIHQRIGAGTRGLGNKSSSGEHANYSIVTIGQNNDKSLRRFLIFLFSLRFNAGVENSQKSKKIITA